jgi:hypothetical protein
MSFFELDGGAKKRKSTKPKTPAKKAPTKKAPTKKAGTKKGGNFLGTVSELFAPAGWENFVTAAGLLALDRTDNYLRKSKDSKKQRGGADDMADTTPKMEEMESFTSRMSGGARKRSSSRRHRGGTDDDTPKMEEEMTGGARKRSSSRKQRGGSDGHHTIEYLDAVGGEDPEMSDMTVDMTPTQTGGAKSKGKGKGKGKGKARKQKGGAMTPEAKESFLRTYHSEPEEAKQLIQIYDSASSNNTLTNNNQSTRANKIISKVIQTHSQSLTPVSETIVRNNLNKSLQQANAQQAQEGNQSFFGGKKPKSKAKKAPKKPKAKKTKTKGSK